jgi:hypothetical protein
MNENDEQLQRWLQLDWRIARGGNFHLDTKDFNVVVWLQRNGRWQARVLHRESGAKRFSGFCVTIEEAKAAAFDLAAQMRDGGARSSTL